MEIEGVDQEPVLVDYEFQAADFSAYTICSSLFATHLKSLAPDRAAAGGRVLKLALKALVLVGVFGLVFFGVSRLLEAGYSVDLLSSSNYPIYGLIAGIGFLSSAQMVVRHRSQMKTLFAVYAANPFSVRLEASGFSVKTKRMDASFSWDAKSCRVTVWKTYLFILHPNTMVILPERALSHPMSALANKIDEWQTKTA